MKVELSVVDPTSTAGLGHAASPRWSGWSDWVGIVASIGCGIHCAAMPFVIAYLPTLGLSFLADEAFHKWMAFGCFTIALTAFVPGLRKHGQLTPVIVGSLGLAMISLAAFGFAGECCTACESNAASVGVTTPGLSANATSSFTFDGCTEECCSVCADDASANETEEPPMASLTTVAVPAQSPAFSGLVTPIAPWLTPLGGIILVAAHLLNRRYGCLGGCCVNDSASGIA